MAIDSPYTFGKPGALLTQEEIGRVRKLQSKVHNAQRLWLKCPEILRPIAEDLVGVAPPEQPEITETNTFGDTD